MIAGEYGSKEGVPVETVIQQLLDRAYGEGNAKLLPASPIQFLVLPYQQVEMSVEDAIRQLAYILHMEVEFTYNPPTVTLRR